MLIVYNGPRVRGEFAQPMIMNAEDARMSPFPKGNKNAKRGETPVLDVQGPRAASWDSGLQRSTEHGAQQRPPARRESPLLQ